MLMLLLALAFLYGLMYLMTAFVKDRPEVQKQEWGDKREETSIGKRRAAAIAVALARAEQERVAIGAPEAGKQISDWLALHHQRQLTCNLPTRRVQ